MSGNQATSSSTEMFRPPVNQAMRLLDRAFFKKRVPLAAATVLEKKQISPCRTKLADDLLRLERMSSVISDPRIQDTEKGLKALLLKPNVRYDNSSTWSNNLRELIDEKKVDVVPYVLDLNYDYWGYHDIMSAILPEDSQDEIPSGFSIVGHIAHLNLREPYLPYKTLIANVLLDKNPNIRTVINKIDEVGMKNEYRTFQYELLAGDPCMDVEVRESDCAFQFNYSRVYWNPRLHTEHKRLVDIFRPGEAICDVMAGTGPFSIPAGKKKAFVWANDLNPDSYASLVDAISRNKVGQFVKSFNMDGREFIQTSAKQLLEHEYSIKIVPKVSRNSNSLLPSQPTEKTKPTFITRPRVFNHYVMNLPATAITFLDAFIGIYHGQEKLFTPHTTTKLPMIHVHCFSTKSDDNAEEKIKICAEISKRLGVEVGPEEQDVEIWDVRGVAPQKRMFCASFRLPAEVAFQER